MFFGNKREIEEIFYWYVICLLWSLFKEKIINLIFFLKICKVNLFFLCVLLSELKIYVVCFFLKIRYFNMLWKCWNCKYFMVIG